MKFPPVAVGGSGGGQLGLIVILMCSGNGNSIDSVVPTTDQRDGTQWLVVAASADAVCGAAGTDGFGGGWIFVFVVSGAIVIVSTLASKQRR